MRNRLNRLIALVVVVPFVIACANSSSQTSTSAATAASSQSTAAASTATTSGSTSSVSTATASGATSLDEAVNAVWQAMQSRNETRMRSFMGASLLQQAGTQQMRLLMNCVPAGSTVTIANHTVETSGNNAKVTVTFNVSSGSGTPTTVQKVWDFVHLSNGTWLLLTLPGCPLK